MKAGYYAVIFTSKRTPADESGYSEMAQHMYDLAARQPGFIGVEHARESIGITVSYWESLQSISDWKTQSEHLLAQQKGRASWYEAYHIRICKVEREYEFHKTGTGTPGLR
ncbi:antibiotic biosynthesis monooxygenase family protein [Robiginitalea sp.]|uniref:antibiotic biosynthesis monooxygenase family protein n=1 Tax=Robiginitalea sp. TaxID=1902411 RepID=UPI003C786AE7